MKVVLAIIGVWVLWKTMVALFRLLHGYSIYKGGPVDAPWCLACKVDAWIHRLCCHRLQSIECEDPNCPDSEP